MEDCKSTPSPLQSGVKLYATCTSPKVVATLYHYLVGSLLYLTHSCPDLSFAVGCVARYIQTPHESYWKEAKRILWCIPGTLQFGIHYSTEGTPLLVGLTDSNWVSNNDDRNSTVGYVFALGFGPITWDCKKQQDFYLASTEANDWAIINASEESLWIQ